MSGDLSILKPTDEDISKLLMAGVHLGSRNLSFQMKKYIYKRRSDGTHIINIHKTWEKLLLAARIVVAIENPKDVCAISGPTFGQRAVLKFGVHVGATPFAGRYTPGTFTNQIQRAFLEPRILVCTDPRVDHQPIIEASYVNIPVIAFCDADSPLRYVDVAVPGNNKAINSIGLLWWMLAREVLRFRSTILRTTPWEIMPDLYFYRDLEEAEKEEAAAKTAEYEAAPQWDEAAAAGEWGAAPAIEGVQGDIQGQAILTAVAPVTDDWSATGPGQDWSTSTTGWDAAAPQQ